MHAKGAAQPIHLERGMLRQHTTLGLQCDAAASSHVMMFQFNSSCHCQLHSHEILANLCCRMCAGLLQRMPRSWPHSRSKR